MFFTCLTYEIIQTETCLTLMIFVTILKISLFAILLQHCSSHKLFLCSYLFIQADFLNFQKISSTNNTFIYIYCLITKMKKQKNKTLYIHRKSQTTDFDFKFLIKKHQQKRNEKKIQKSYSIGKSKKEIIIPSMAVNDRSFRFVSTKYPDKQKNSDSLELKNSKQIKSTKKLSAFIETMHRNQNPSTGILQIATEIPFILVDSKQLQTQKKVRTYRSKRFSTRQNLIEKRDFSGKGSQRSIGLKVQTILRRKVGLNFEGFIKQYCQRMKLNSESKIFIFNSSDHWVKRNLVKRGWIQNADKQSRAFHLKWTSKVQKYSFHNKQILNHFSQSDCLTSKEGLAKYTMKCGELKKIIPRSYDLGTEMDLFIKNYEQTLILSGLKKVVGKISRQQKATIQIIDNKQLKENFCEMMRKQNFTNCTQFCFLMHIPFIVQLCGFCELLREKIEKEKPQTHFQLNRNAFTKLVHFCQIDPTYIEFHESRFTQLEGPQSYQSNIVFNQSDLSFYKSKGSFAYPSVQLIRILFSYYKYLETNYQTFSVQGEKNIWICKNRNSSKGAGIFLTSRLEEIMKKRGNYIIQKYIQDCCLFSSKTLNNVKFDLRIWVLVLNFNPLLAYYYSDFYGRPCYDSYDLNDNSCSKHITNYTMNKSFFADQQESIITSPQFFDFMQNKLNFNLRECQSLFFFSLEKLIYETLRQYEGIIKGSEQNFELYGFDILPSSNFNLHLLQVNLSPACKQRNPWLNNVLEEMTDQLLQIVLENDFLQRKESKWKEIKNISN